jgi:hypothetical protein
MNHKSKLILEVPNPIKVVREGEQFQENVEVNENIQAGNGSLYA